MTEDRKGQRDLVADITAPHRDKGLARNRGRERFRVERVLVRLNVWRRVWYLFTGGVIAVNVARAPQRVSGVEVLDVKVLSARQLRRLERMRKEEDAKHEPHPVVLDKTAGDDVVAALKGLAR